VWTASAAQAERSVWDGVYTEAQAIRGQNTFGTICAACHEVADFSNSSFLQGWEASTVLDLFQLVQKTMPMDNPGSLRPQDYIDVISYFFRANQIPAGKDELDTDAEHLKLIRITGKKEAGSFRTRPHRRVHKDPLYPLLKTADRLRNDHLEP
jgi:S-disulfanyl-L-cysteine oxidoreductase SoxD